MDRIGVVLCPCELEGVPLFNPEVVVETLKGRGEVLPLIHDPPICSESGMEAIRAFVENNELDRVVVACSKPELFGPPFKKALRRWGLNPSLSEVLGIPPAPERASEGGIQEALRVIQNGIDEIRGRKPSKSQKSPFVKRVMVIGGGITGITASIDLGNAGYEVLLVDRLPSIGGRMLQLSETFPTLDCAQCTLTPKTVETGQHPHIRLITHAEVESVSGDVGNFLVKIRRKAAYVDWEKCTGCGLCQEKCPSKVPSEFERGVGLGKAIYTLSPQAVPNKPVINREVCRYFTKGKCRVCEKVCPAGAIDYDQEDTLIEERVGAIIVATGFDLYPKEEIGEYGYGDVPDVIDGLAFERLNSASGPTAGEIRRPSDGRVPKEVVFIQCVASRDPERYMPYCSRACCMYTAKHARLYKHKVHDGRAYIFYMDIRSMGKGYEEFIQQGVEEEGILYLRGRVSRLFRDNNHVVVWGADTLTGKKVEIAADMVVLATAMIPSRGAKELAEKLHIGTDEYGFLTEAQWKLYPVESGVEGIYLAGCAQGPKDIADTVAQGNAAASKVQALFAQH
ncbi:MAG: 4Fe-4S binding protein [Thermodesulfobacteriota bacterium]